MSNKKIFIGAGISILTISILLITILNIKGKFGGPTSDIFLDVCIAEVIAADDTIENYDDITTLVCENENSTRISSLEGIEKLTNLEELELFYAYNLKDISALENVSNLRVLKLADSKVSDISVFESLTKLEELEFSDTAITDLSVIKKLDNLKALNIGGNGEVDDISFVSEMIDLETLDISYVRGTDIPDLENLVNLKTLNVAGNELTDFSDIGDLETLEELDVSSNDITEMSTIGNLDSLKVLNVRGNSVMNLSGLEKLSNLTSLGIDFDFNAVDFKELESLIYLEEFTFQFAKDCSEILNQVGPDKVKMIKATFCNLNDTTDFERFSKLETLEIVSASFDSEQEVNNTFANLYNLKEFRLLRSNIDVSSLEDFLKGSDNLETLIIEGGTINSFVFTSNIPKLKHLEFDFLQGVEDFSPISKLKNLETLKAYTTYIDSISFLEDCKEIKTFHMRNSDRRTEVFDGDLSYLKYLENVESLDIETESDFPMELVEKMSNLETLYVESDEIDNIESIKYATNLKGLYLPNNQIEDISVFKHLTNLEVLDLQGNMIEDISPLKDLTSLKKLNLESNDIKDISPVKNLKNLRTLDISYNEIENVDALEELVLLKSLYMNENKISDISVIENLVNLEVLSAYDNRITDISPLSKLYKLKYLDVFSNPIEDFSPIEDLDLESLDE